MVFQYKIVYDMQHNKIINWSSDFRGGFGRDCFLYKDILISQECERGVIGVNAYTGEKKYSGLWPLGYDHPNYGGEGRCDQYELYFSRIVDGYIVAVSEFGRVICFKFLK